MEVVDLRKKNRKTYAFVKFKNNSAILDEILESQRYPFDKTSLGYKKEGEMELGPPRLLKQVLWCPKLKAMLHLHNTKKTSEYQKDVKKLGLILKADLEGKQF